MSYIFVDMRRILVYFSWILLVSCNPSEEELIQKARDLLDSGEPKESLGWLDRAIEQNSENPETYNMRGVANFQLGNNQEAIKDWENAILLDSMNYKLH